MANPRLLTIYRTGNSEEPEKDEVEIEKSRIETVDKIKTASDMAEQKKLEDGQVMLVDAQNALDDVVDEPNELIDMLKYELELLWNLMNSQDIYNEKGRPFALSSLTSHGRQRCAARGDNVEKLGLFSTPRMKEYIKQAKEFDKDPSKPPPTEDQDVKQERDADPLGPIVGAISYYIETAIQSLKAIQNIINKSR